jgi:hypothetical protein
MGKICAPVRDKEVRELTRAEGVVPVFRGILEVSRIPDFLPPVNLWLFNPIYNFHVTKSYKKNCITHVYYM